MAGPKNPFTPADSASPDENLKKVAAVFDRASRKKAKSVKNGAGKGEKGEEKAKAIPAPNAKKRLAAIKRSEKLRKPFIDEAERFFRYYQGNYDKKGRSSRSDDKMSVNVIYSHIEIVTPAVYSGFPFVKVRPKPRVGESLKDAEARARNMQLVITYWFKELGVDATLRRVFHDTFFGPAFVELGWETIIDDREENTESENGEEQEGPRVTTIKDRPFIIRREFKNMYLDADARDPKEITWIAIEEVMRYNDFIASSQFTEKAKNAVKPQLYPKSEDEKEAGDRPEDTSEKEWVQIFTIWDKNTRKKYVVTDGYDGFLNSEDEEGQDWPYEMEYQDDPFPVCIHHGKPDRATSYSWSEFRAYEPQVKELNRNRQALQIHVKASLPRYMATSSFATKQQMNKLTRSRSDEITVVETPEALKVVPVAEMPKDSHAMAVMSKEDLIEVSGLKEYQGIAASTATEANIQDGQSKMRKTMRSKLWEQFVVEIAAKLAQLCQQNMDEAIVAEIAGQKGIEWVQVTKEQIQGEFFFDIEPGIMEYKNESLRKQQLLKFVELAGGDPNVNKRMLLSKVAQEFDISPEDVILPIDEVPAAPADPQITFKPIDPLSINDSAMMNALLITALRQNGVDVNALIEKISGASVVGSNDPKSQLLAQVTGAGEGGGTPPNLRAIPGGGGEANMPKSGGKNMAGNGANPNGNPALPPVSGNVREGGGGVNG